MIENKDLDILATVRGSAEEWTEFWRGNPGKWIRAYISASMEESVAKMEDASTLDELKLIQGGRLVLKNFLQSLQDVVQSKSELQLKGPQNVELDDTSERTDGLNYNPDAGDDTSGFPNEIGSFDPWGAGR